MTKILGCFIGQGQDYTRDQSGQSNPVTVA